MREARTARVGIGLEPELLAAIDQARGSEARTTWIEDAISLALDGALPARPECPVCGVPIPPSAHGNRRVYCTIKCLRVAQAAAPRPAGRCSSCRGPLPAGRAGHCDACREKAKRRRLAEPAKAAAYNAARRRTSEVATCKGCGEPFESKRKDRMYCSLRCGKEARRGKEFITLGEASARGVQRQRELMADPEYRRTWLANQRFGWAVRRVKRAAEVVSTPPLLALAAGPAPVKPPKNYYKPVPKRWLGCRCEECGEAFLASRPCRFCTVACNEKSQRRKAKKKRSQRIRSNEPRESVDIFVVAKRDGWRCHLCGGTVVRATWSLDHLLPLARGGAHNYANVKLAHHRCNSRRGIKSLPVRTA